MASTALDPRAPEFFPTPTFITYCYHPHHYHHHRYYQRINMPTQSHYWHLMTLPGPAHASPPPPNWGRRRRPSRKKINYRPRSRKNIYGRDHDEFGRPSCRPRVLQAAAAPTPSNSARDREPSSAAPMGRRRFSYGEAKVHQKPPHLMFPGGDRDIRTTVMIRNIPNRYTREMLKDFVDEHCSAENKKRKRDKKCATHISAFDFLYLPIDFRSKWNKGYAFVNFTSTEAMGRFFEAAHDKLWDRFRSSKIREICYARLQGKGSLLSHFERMEFPCKEFQPVLFEPARDGSGKLVDEICVGRIKLL